MCVRNILHTKQQWGMPTLISTECIVHKCTYTSILIVIDDLDVTIYGTTNIYGITIWHVKITQLNVLVIPQPLHPCYTFLSL